MKKFVVLLILAGAVLATASIASANNCQPTKCENRHIRVSLGALNGSGITGSVSASPVNKEPARSETMITVYASAGAIPGASYKAYYYSSTNCSGAGTIIGGPYTANSDGTAKRHAKVEAALKTINSASMTDSNGTVVACGNLH